MMQGGVNHGTPPPLNTHKILPRGYILSSSKNYKKIFSTLLTIILFHSLYNNLIIFFYL